MTEHLLRHGLSRRECLALFAAGVAMLKLGRAHAAGYEPTLDGMQGYVFDPKVQPSFGFLTSFTLGGTKFPADHALSYSFAEGPSTAGKTKTSVVGVLDRVQWREGASDPLLLSATVSAGTKETILQQKLSLEDPPAVKVGFVVFAWDAQAKRYYTAFGSSPTRKEALVEGRIRSNGTKLAMSVSDDPSSTLSVPERYLLELEITPGAKAQQLLLASSASSRGTRVWGNAK